MQSIWQTTLLWTVLPRLQRKYCWKYCINSLTLASIVDIISRLNRQESKLNILYGSVSKRLLSRAKRTPTAVTENRLGTYINLLKIEYFVWKCIEAAPQPSEAYADRGFENRFDTTKYRIKIEYFVWKCIEAVITRRSWKPFGWKPPGVRIPPLPPMSFAF